MVGCDGGDALRWPDVTTSSQAGVRQVVVPPFEGATVLFRVVRRGGGTGVGGTVSWNDTGLPTQYPHSPGDGRAVRVGRTVPGYDSQAVSESRHGGNSPLTWAPVSYQSI
jgi:hypothetical protein